MGIENFFNTLSKTKVVEKKYIDEIELEGNYLYIDFNSIIHLVVDDFEYDINYYLYSLIINQIDEYTENVKTKYGLNFNNLDDFLKYFTQEKVDDFIKENIYSFIKKLCNNVKNKNKLKEIFISFDGTPTFSKITEQKRRKYLNYIISEFKHNIYLEKSDKIDEFRQIFYKNKVSFGINQSNKFCGNWTGHIQDIYNNISSFHFKMEIYEICPSLSNFIVSSAYEFGEGEKKITEHILQHKRSGSYIIFSPDSDTVLLSIIIYNKLKRLNIDTDFNILKYDSNEKKIEYISIVNVIDNLFEIVFSKMNPYRKHNHDKINIIDDLICIFTFFGNDFLPKIESLNMRNGMDILLTLYVRNFNFSRAKHPYILNNENDTVKINMNAFIVINSLGENEDKILYDKYLSNEFKNFNYISNIFGINEYTPFFIDKLNRYCHGFNKVVRYIKLNPEKTSEEVYKNIIQKFTDKCDWERCL